MPKIYLYYIHTGITDAVTEYSTYPVKEHTKLLSSSGKPASTPLNSMLAMRMIKIPTDRNDPNYKDQTLLETYKKNALTLTFRGTHTVPVSMVEWEEFYLHLVPLVVEHPKILLSESKNLTNSMMKLYRALNKEACSNSKVFAHPYWRTILGHQGLKKMTKLKKSS